MSRCGRRVIALARGESGEKFANRRNAGTVIPELRRAPQKYITQIGYPLHRGVASRGLVWAVCEALERRHNLGRGTLVVLDLVP